MKLADIRNALTATEIPTAYRCFEGKVTPPYAAYYESESDAIAGDMKTVARWGSYRVELYTDGKDLIAEQKIESALDGIGAIYDKSEVYTAESKLLEIIYEFEGVET